jgi:hypothetical protein
METRDTGASSDLLGLGVAGQDGETEWAVHEAAGNPVLHSQVLRFSETRAEIRTRPARSVQVSLCVSFEHLQILASCRGFCRYEDIFGRYHELGT